MNSSENKTTAYLGIGSNMGDSKEILKTALQKIDQVKGIEVKKVSSLYMTEPVGFIDQPWFYNCVAEVVTELPSIELLHSLQQIENDLGRVRTVRWGPRTLDLDILLFGNEIINEPELIVPHPRMLERAFVLIPLKEIAKELILPNGDGKTIKDAVAGLSHDQKYSCITEPLW